MSEREDVVECAVVPSPDPIRHALVKDFVTLRGCQPSREIVLSIPQGAGAVQECATLEFLDLPKTISRKIRWVQLRTAEEGRGRS